ncbi:hypothetical protein AMTRI_Chr08g209810 [Amborella trichopoda]
MLGFLLFSFSLSLSLFKLSTVPSIHGRIYGHTSVIPERLRIFINESFTRHDPLQMSKRNELREIVERARLLLLVELANYIQEIVIIR